MADAAEAMQEVYTTLANGQQARDPSNLLNNTDFTSEMDRAFDTKDAGKVCQVLMGVRAAIERSEDQLHQAVEASMATWQAEIQGGFGKTMEAWDSEDTEDTEDEEEEDREDVKDTGSEDVAHADEDEDEGCKIEASTPSLKVFKPYTTAQLLSLMLMEGEFGTTPILSESLFSHSVRTIEQLRIDHHHVRYLLQELMENDCEMHAVKVVSNILQQANADDLIRVMMDAYRQKAEAHEVVKKEKEKLELEREKQDQALEVAINEQIVALKAKIKDLEEILDTGDCAMEINLANRQKMFDKILLNKQAKFNATEKTLNERLHSAKTQYEIALSDQQKTLDSMETELQSQRRYEYSYKTHPAALEAKEQDLKSGLDCTTSHFQTELAAQQTRFDKLLLDKQTQLEASEQVLNDKLHLTKLQYKEAINSQQMEFEAKEKRLKERLGLVSTHYAKLGLDPEGVKAAIAITQAGAMEAYGRREMRRWSETNLDMARRQPD